MIEYGRAVAGDIDEIEELYRKYLDCGELLRERLINVCAEDGTISCKAVDNESGKIVGIAIYTRGITLSCGHHEICSIVEDWIGNSPVYTGESLAVSNEYRGMKVGHRLNEHIYSYLKELCSDNQSSIYVLHEMWVYPDGKTPAYPVVKDVYGIDKDFGEFSGFYKNYYKDGYLCPICGEHCVCSARITLSKIDK